MSYFHINELLRIQKEHRAIVDILNSFNKKQTTPGKLKPTIAKMSVLDADGVGSAINSINDAYALLLIATAERFMRQYLQSLNLNAPIGSEPKLSALIEKCRKEFNKSKPRITIKPDEVRQMQNLRIQRNMYAHGDRLSVFPAINQIVQTLGIFFDKLP